MSMVGMETQGIAIAAIHAKARAFLKDVFWVSALVAEFADKIWFVITTAM